MEERRKIDKWHDAKMPVPEIADRLGRAPSSIYRELKRNYYDDKEIPELNGYYSVTAQRFSEERRAIHRKMVAHPELKAAIEDRLKGQAPCRMCGRKCFGWPHNDQPFPCKLGSTVLRNADTG